MPLKAVTSGAVRSWASPHTMKQLVNNQNGTIMSLSISGSFFNVIRTHLLRWRARLHGQSQPPIRVGQTDDPARYSSVRFTTLPTDSTVLTRVALA